MLPTTSQNCAKTAHFFSPASLAGRLAFLKLRIPNAFGRALLRTLEVRLFCNVSIRAPIFFNFYSSYTRV